MFVLLGSLGRASKNPELRSAHHSHDTNSVCIGGQFGESSKKKLSCFSAHHSHDTNSVCIGGQFGESSRNPLSYVLLIISFVLAWVETWFLDFKVLPWERKELQKLAMPTHGTVLAAVCLHLLHLNNNNVHLSRAYQCLERSHNSEIFMYLF